MHPTDGRYSTWFEYNEYLLNNPYATLKKSRNDFLNPQKSQKWTFKTAEIENCASPSNDQEGWRYRVFGGGGVLWGSHILGLPIRYASVLVDYSTYVGL